MCRLVRYVVTRQQCEASRNESLPVADLSPWDRYSPQCRLHGTLSIVGWEDGATTGRRDTGGGRSRIVVEVELAACGGTRKAAVLGIFTRCLETLRNGAGTCILSEFTVIGEAIIVLHHPGSGMSTMPGFSTTIRPSFSSVLISVSTGALAATTLDFAAPSYHNRFCQLALWV